MANGTLTPTARHLRAEIVVAGESPAWILRSLELYNLRELENGGLIGSKPNEVKKSLTDAARGDPAILIMLGKGDVPGDGMRLSGTNGVEPASVLV
jgi:hypothetical protein